MKKYGYRIFFFETNTCNLAFSYLFLHQRNNYVFCSFTFIRVCQKYTYVFLYEFCNTPHCSRNDFVRTASHCDVASSQLAD